jgi:signal transduction histidine kinase/ActR/RegA family two-component response regulator
MPDRARLRPSAVGRALTLHLPVALAAVVGVALSTLVFFLIRGWERDRMDNAFDIAAQNVISIFKRGIDSNVNALESVGSFYAASVEVEPREFSSFVRPYLDRYAGITGFAWIPRVRAEEIESLEGFARESGFEEFQVVERRDDGRLTSAGARSEYFPSLFLEPSERNPIPRGYDFAVDELTQNVMRAARDRGRPLATSPWIASGMAEDVYLVFHPIYDNDAEPRTDLERADALVGFVAAALRPQAMLSDALWPIRPEEVDLWLVDPATPEGGRVITSYAAASGREMTDGPRLRGVGETFGISHEASVSLAGRKLVADCQPSAAFLANQQTWIAWFGLTIGLFCSWLLASYLHSSIGRTEAIEGIVDERTAELSVANMRLQNEIRDRLQAEDERSRLQDQLRQSQKLEAIGTLAGGVAHDFNNLLTGILGYSGIIRLQAASGGKIAEAAEVIENAAERAKNLTAQLLGFARKGKNQHVPVDVAAIIQEVVTLLSRTINKKIVMRQRIGAPKSIVMGDPGQLQQVILNLAVNARDAMPEGGELAFETEIVDLDENYCQTHPEAAPGRHLAIAVSDTGGGIPREIQDRIFEPFFTTKGRGEGSGMGLAMVYGIVKNHGGSIGLYSESGKGTTIRIYLPFTESEVSRLPAHEEAAAIAGRGVILFVDDEVVVRQVGAEMLRTLGYEVVTARDGAEAVEIYERLVDGVDLAIVDMMMPKMDGKECFQQLRRINPRLRAILSTGYGRDGAAQEILAEGMVGFVQKPYRMSQLSETVATALRPLKAEERKKGKDEGGRMKDEFKIRL